MTVIYNIVNPIDDTVLYVGKSKTFEKRKIQHLSNAHNTPLRNSIRLIQSNGIEPVFNILENCEDFEFSKMERKWINHFRGLGYDLFNQKNGVKGDLMYKTLNGNPATQKNVTLKDTKIEQIKQAGKLQYMSFSAYVNKLIDADLSPNQITPHP